MSLNSQEAPGTSNVPRGVLVSDYDGTMTRHDFYELAIAELVPPGTPDYWGHFLTGGMTVFEVLSRIFAAIRADEQTILETARRCQLSSGLGESMLRLQAAGWKIVVASAGCGWYIERILAEAGVTNVEIHANPGRVIPGGGLEMTRPEASPFFSQNVGIDKAAVVQAQLAYGCPVAFAGDGKPDFAASRVVPAALRFARADLAEKLRAHGESYRPFQDWTEVADTLLALS